MLYLITGLVVSIRSICSAYDTDTELSSKIRRSTDGWEADNELFLKRSEIPGDHGPYTKRIE